MQYKYQLYCKKYIIRSIVYMQYDVHNLTTLLYFLCNRMRKRLG